MDKTIFLALERVFPPTLTPGYTYSCHPTISVKALKEYWNVGDCPQVTRERT